MRLPDSERSRAVLIGTSTYTDDSGFESLPAVRKNLTDLERLLRQETGLRHVAVLLDPDSPKAFGNVLKNAIDKAEDLLLFYFSGHGLCINNELALTYTETTTIQPGYTTVPFPTIRDDIRRSPARVKLVFLDCCHSGKAFGAGTLAGDEDEILKELAVIEGAYVLTATGTKSKFARASSQSGHTAFTGALLEVLRSGTPSPDEFLSMDAVYPLLKTKLAGANLPEPKSSGRDTAAKLALVRNSRRLEVGSTRSDRAITSPLSTPVYNDLEASLAEAEQQPDPTVAHTLAVAANYAYSDAKTVSMMLARMGLQNHCLKVDMSVDARLIRSTAYLIQSSDGSVVILAYRGTEPTNLFNLLTDADVHRERIAFPLPHDAEAVPVVHALFYRNVRATRFEVIAALQRALDRRSVLDDDPGSPRPPMEKPMTTLYLTGHGLGGAMAALMAVMLSVEKEYIYHFAPVFKGASTFGSPMVGSPDFAKACAANTFLDRNVVRYVYRNDLVPHLPLSDAGKFQHFGREYRYNRAWNDTSDKPITQLGLIEAPLGFVASKFRLLRGIPFGFSLNDHRPQNYLAALTPPHVESEFGGYVS